MPAATSVGQRWQRWQRRWSLRTSQASGRRSGQGAGESEGRNLCQAPVGLGEALAALAARMEPKDAASVAVPGAVLANSLEEIPRRKRDGQRRSRLGQTLAALAAAMEPKDAASVVAADRQVLPKALENSADEPMAMACRLWVWRWQRWQPGWSPRTPQASRTVWPGAGEFEGRNLWRAPAELGPGAGSVGSADGAQGGRKRRGTPFLAKALEKAEERNPSSLPRLGWALGGISRLIPGLADATRRALQYAVGNDSRPAGAR